MTASIPVEGRAIGAGQPCFIVAEIGINHNGDLELAKRMCDAAAAAGADAVKFQNYRTEDFLSDSSLMYTYRSRGVEITESQWEMFKRCEPPTEWADLLQQHCTAIGVTFFSTPTSIVGVDELVAAGSPLLKNGSDCLTHTPLLEAMGATGLPVIISTGMADAEDIDNAVEAVRRGGASPIILLHCTSAYPTPIGATNLRRMLSLRERFALPVGFSDHTEGWRASAQAVGLGAVLIEKHFTLDHDLEGPDHWFSSTPDEFAVLVEEIRDAETRLGHSEILPTIEEARARAEYRLSVVAAVDLRAGAILGASDVAIRRPSGGLLPKDLPAAIGRRIARAIPRGKPITDSDLI